MRAHSVLTPLVLTLALFGCEKSLEAPTDPGVCWHMAVAPNGGVKFNQLATGQKDLEHCAAQLDQMRIRFLGLGSTQQDVVGAYQGQFLFDGPQGVYTSATFKGFRYLLLVHSGDGRLVVQGAMPAQ
jgi:hypothetical protein